mmetsp:Transcript_2103/g.2677  ORF Transcript_2103/g.2677 Transcript_2103/m.2677 type:complete len:86 (-) Transcript_2103:29-286(-)
MGFQLYGSVFSLISYWVINIPLAYILCIHFEYRLVGIWIAVQFGSTFACICYFVKIFTTDWEQLVIDINERIEEDKKELSAIALS